MPNGKLELDFNKMNTEDKVLWLFGEVRNIKISNYVIVITVTLNLLFNFGKLIWG